MKEKRKVVAGILCLGLSATMLLTACKLPFFGNGGSVVDNGSGNSSSNDTPVAQEYTVTLNYNNGERETRKVKGGELLGKLPEKDTGASEIVGWSTVPNQLVEYEGRVSTDLILYAIWRNYKVVTLVYGVEDVREEKVYEDSDGEAMFPNASKENYVLDGWSETENGAIGSVKFDELGDTYYANWTAAYAISSVDGLKAIANDPAAYYYLTCDVNMKAEEWIPIDTFDGILEGNGHKLFNFILSTNSPGEKFGFFNQNNGTIQNLTLDDYTFNVTGNINRSRTCVGILTGYNTGRVENCCIQNAATGFDYQINNYSSGVFDFGGMVGRNVGGVLSSCRSTVDLTGAAHMYSDGYNHYYVGYPHVGGLLGSNDGGTVKNCSYQGKINTTQYSSKGGSFSNASANNTSSVGGLLGENCANSVCLNGYAEAELTNAVGSVYYASAFIGIFAGTNDGVISECAAKGSVVGGTNNDGWIGGFIGYNRNSIVNCHVEGSVTGNRGTLNVGGFVGQNEGKVQNSYSTTTVSSTVSGTIGGFVGNNLASGSISKCWSAGDVIATTQIYGLFAASNAGVLNKNYYASEGTLTVNGEEAEDASGLGEEKELVTLQSGEFLLKTLYWEEEFWTVTEGGNPILHWEAE